MKTFWSLVAGVLVLVVAAAVVVRDRESDRGGAFAAPLPDERLPARRAIVGDGTYRPEPFPRVRDN